MRAVTMANGEVPPHDAWPHFYLGRTLLKRGNTERAIDVLYQGETIVAERRRPHRHLLAAIRSQLAIAYVYASDFESAKRLLDLASTEHGGDAEFVWALALYRAATGDAGRPDELATDTLKDLDPNKARDRYSRCQVYLFRALVYLGIGNSSRASEEFSRAHREDPRNVFVMVKWAKTLLDLAHQSDVDGEHQAAHICAEQAKSVADKILEFDTDNSPAREILEAIYDDFGIS